MSSPAPAEAPAELSDEERAWITDALKAGAEKVRDVTTERSGAVDEFALLVERAKARGLTHQEFAAATGYTQQRFYQLLQRAADVRFKTDIQDMDA